jgi:hypothetical protein
VTRAELTVQRLRGECRGCDGALFCRLRAQRTSNHFSDRRGHGRREGVADLTICVSSLTHEPPLPWESLKNGCHLDGQARKSLEARGRRLVYDALTIDT